jgi:hypothetical protein
VPAGVEAAAASVSSCRIDGSLKLLSSLVLFHEHHIGSSMPQQVFTPRATHGLLCKNIVTEGAKRSDTLGLQEVDLNFNCE